MPTDTFSAGHTRRSLLAATIGGLAAAATHALGRPLPALAGHGDADNAEALHLERTNVAAGDTSLDGTSSHGTLTLRNTNGAHALQLESTGQAIVARQLGELDSHTAQFEHDGEGAGAAVFARGFNFGVEAESTGEFGAGVVGYSERAPGVAGESNGDAPGVVGVNGSGFYGNFGQGSGPGVEGISGSGPGVKALSQSGNAFEGFSNSGTGVFVGGSPAVDATGGVVGISGWSADGVAGVVGVGSIMRGEGTPPEMTRGVLGIAPGNAPAVQCVSGGFLDPETQPWAPGASDGGLALDVVGKARFATAGAATVPHGHNSVFVPNTAVTSRSHVSITLASDPGPRQLRWVSRSSGIGFTVFFAGGPPGQRPATDFTYFIAEPAQ